jgi:RNA polymerase sigma-70 factor (ECF subfamily)
MEDQIAISRIKQGDLNGLETLVSRYQVQAVRAAYLILYDRSLAEDVAQTAFVKAAQRIHQFNDGRPFGPWFSRIVVNDTLKLAKKQERSVSLDEHLDDSTVQLAKWLADPDPNPEQLNIWMIPLCSSQNGSQIQTRTQSSWWSKRKPTRSS